MANFSSRCSNQVLCVKQARNSIVDGILVHVPGEHIRFENGEFQSNDKKEIDFLRKHRLFGSAIVEIKGTDAGAATE